MAAEQLDKPTPGSAAMNLLILHCRHLGDSRIVECTHQTAKDVLRDSRHFQRAVTSRMSAVIHSPALAQRKLNPVPLPVKEKVQSGQRASDQTHSFKKKAPPEKHKMDKAFQRMLLPNRGRSSWPSPTPASSYQAVAATEFLFRHFGNEENLGNAWLSILCGQPGSIIAQRHTGELVWTVTYSEYCFLAWRLKVHVADTGER